MPFTVVRQGGTKDDEYQTYARLLSRQLLERGVSLDSLPRVRGGGTGNVWLYVWESEDEASAFAAELTKRPRDAHWRGQPVEAKPALGPLRPLEIDVGRQQDGWAFGLEPLTRTAIQVRFPGSCRLRSIFVGSENRDAFLAESGDLTHL